MGVLTEEEIDLLVDASLDARKHSYSPYSKFRVGCALLTSDGKLITGCNVENASYGLTICAERTAYTKAISDGMKSFRIVAVATDIEDDFTYPCGACRQFMAEFGDVDVMVVKNNKEYDITKLSVLLPKSFQREDLQNYQDKNEKNCW